MDFNLTKTQRWIIQIVRQGGPYFKIWAVGGALRDRFLNKEPKDIDFVTNKELDGLVYQCKCLGLTVIDDIIARKHGIIKIADLDTGDIIDIAWPRHDKVCDGRHAEIDWGDDIESDLERRDFTINAFAAEIYEDGSTGEIIDRFQGREDLERHIIRFIGNPIQRIQEDYLRMLRACRFTALGEDWQLSQEAVEAIKKNAAFIHTISAERIRDEIIKAFKYQKPSNFIRALNECNLLQHIIPSIARCINVQGGPHHNESVWDHLLLSLDAGCEAYGEKGWPFLLSTSLHDVGKAKAFKEENGKITFHKHEVYGAEIVYEWMKSLKFTNQEIDYVTTLIRNHMIRYDDNVSDKTLRKLLFRVGSNWKDLICLRYCDRKGNLAKQGLSDIPSKVLELFDRLQAIVDSGVPIFKEDLAINGDDIKKLGIKPGPIYKEIFDNVLGIVHTRPDRNTKEYLLKFIQKNYGVKNDQKGKKETT